MLPDACSGIQSRHDHCFIQFISEQTELNFQVIVLKVVITICRLFDGGRRRRPAFIIFGRRL